MSNRVPSARTLTLVLTAAAAWLAAPVRAQDTTARTARTRTQVLSIQPISSVVGLYSAEYEARISPSATLGVGATAWLDEYDDDATNDTRDRYYSTELKLRFYPGGEPLRGFSVGLTGGVARLRSDEYAGTFGGTPMYRQDTATGGKIGFEMDYNWLLGPTRRFAVSLGAGAKRLLIRDDRPFNSDFIVARAYPTARMSVGIAF